MPTQPVSQATLPTGATQPAGSRLDTHVRWYHTWWAMAPLLLLCFPVAMVVLWTSPRSRQTKLGATAVSALIFGLAMMGALGEEPSDTDLAAAQDERATTTSKPASTTARPTTSSTSASTTTAKPTTTTTTTTTTAPPPPPTTAAPAETVSQMNARRKAADYLELMAFSRAGLIDQLQFEGFSESDATYGVDALKVDWNEQAAKKAAEYLGLMAFSRSGLIDQLVFEGFTRAEAEHGVSTTGL